MGSGGSMVILSYLVRCIFSFSAGSGKVLWHLNGSVALLRVHYIIDQDEVTNQNEKKTLSGKIHFWKSYLYNC